MFLNVWSFRFMSYTCLLMVLCECACANLVSKANFNLINRTDLFICLHIMFKISFQNSMGQKSYCKFFVFGQNFCSVYIPISGSIKINYERNTKTFVLDVILARSTIPHFDLSHLKL